MSDALSCNNFNKLVLLKTINFNLSIFKMKKFNKILLNFFILKIDKLKLIVFKRTNLLKLLQLKASDIFM
tara:strand:- start:272 stop:481 length:210 start_codon:yes stop_codon:yes gene_type:complete